MTDDAEGNRLLADANTAMVRDLGQVLDVEAGLSADTINDGLDNLFRRLGPPADHAAEQ